METTTISLSLGRVAVRNLKTLLFTLLAFQFFGQNSPEPVNGTGPGGTAPFTNMLNCNGTPTFNVNLTGQPSGTWISNPEKRAGGCCNPGGDLNCVQFSVTLDPMAEGIIFNVPDGCGAVPTGSLFYQVNCGPLTSVGTPLCLNGTGPFIITFCKPGSNENCYSITSIPSPGTSGDVITADGCKDTLTTVGLDPSTITWNSISPGFIGQYNNYLNNLSSTQPGISGTAYTGQSTVVVTPQSGYPPVIYYKVCGNVIGACSGTSFCDTVSVSIYPNLFANAGPDVAICNGSVIGTVVTGSVTGGTAPFSYHWTGPGGFNQTVVSSSTTNQMTVMQPGLYTLSITDATGCPAATDQVNVVSFSTNIVANAGSDIIICRTPIPTLTINASVSQTGTGVWSGGSGTYNSSTTDLSLLYTPSAAELAAGSATLTLTPTNNMGCPYTTDQVVITLPQFTSTLSAVPTNISCFGLTNGSIDLTVTGGASVSGYLWTNGQTTQDITGLSVGSYSVTVTDVNGCKGNTSATITQPTQLTASVTSLTNVSCNGGNNGSVTVTGANATAPYTYSLNGGAPQGSGTFSNLVAGSYTITVKDANGCSVNVPVTITQPSATMSITTTQTNVLCYGGTTGAINITPTGGTAPYSFSWSNGSTTEDINGLAAGTYSVTVNDANGSGGGCAGAATVTIFQPPAPLTLSNVSSNVQCFGGSSGSIDLTPSGGTPGYVYLWNNGQSTQDLSGLPVGTYTVSVHDANGTSGGCLATTSITITQPVSAVSLSSTTVNASCNGGSNGSINLTPAGGTPSYTYSWSNGGTSEDLTGLAAGTYIVTVHDASGTSGGCSATSSITITQPANPVTTSFTQTNSSCFGGSNGAVNLSVNGGTAPYSYLWSNGATTQDISGLQSGTYSVTVNDANGNTLGCTSTTTVTILQPLEPVAASATQTDVVCFGGSTGSINLTPSGGTSPYFYSWSNGSVVQDISGLAAGTYTVIITDGAGSTGGCTATLSVTINQPLAPVSIASSNSNVSCFGGSNGSINLTPTGGTPTYTYLWSTGATTQNINNLPAGTYSVTVSDANSSSGGCAATASITITQPTNLTSTISPSVYAGGYNVSGCTADGSANLSVSGGSPGYSFSWSNGASSEDISNLTVGTYNVTITDGNGCQVINSVTLNSPNGMSQTISAFTYPSGSNISCFGLSNGNVNLTITGGSPAYSYMWSNGTTTQDLTGVPAGIYNVTITDANGCQITSSITLTQPPALTQSVSAFAYPSGTNISCLGLSDGSIDLTIGGGSPGYTYSWSNGSSIQDPSALAAGNYSVTATDINGCTILSTITLVQPTVLSSTLTPSVYSGGYNISGCTPDGSINLAATGGNPGYSYTWSNGSTSEDLTGLMAGPYSVTITDINGCQTNSTITLTAPGNMSQSISAFTYPSGTNISCYGLSDGSVNLTITGGSSPYTYAWSNGAASQDLSNVAAGTYNVVINDANGCQITSSITLNEPPALTQTISAFSYPSGTNISCFGLNDGSINLTIDGGNPGYSYTWSNGSTIQDPSNLVAGSYNVVATDVNGCAIAATITLNQPTLLSSSVTPSVYAGGYNISGCTPDGSINLTVSGGNSGYVYNWSNGSGLEDLSGLGAGTYTINVVDINGCQTSNTVSMTAPQTITQSISAYTYTSGTNISCFGLSDGSVNLTVSGGTPGYTYSWSNGALSQDLTNVPAGIYNVTITDANGCQTTSSITLVEPPILTQSISAYIYASGTNISCFGLNDGSINLSVAGGNPGYTYAWSNGSSLQDPVSLLAGTYSVVVSDVNGCSIPSSITLVQPQVISLNESVSVYAGGFNLSGCNPDGWIDLSVAGGNGGFVYEWTNGQTTQDIEDLSAAYYSVIVTDINGCQATIDTVLNQPPSLVSTTSVTSNYHGRNISCNGLSDGAITVNITGGTPTFTYSWVNEMNIVVSNEQSPSGLPSGTYTVSFEDQNGCLGTNSVTLIDPPVFSYDIAVSSNYNGQNISCFGAADGSINLTALGGTPAYIYSWTNSVNAVVSTQQDPNGLVAGTYQIRVEDLNGCYFDTVITLTQPPQIVATTQMLSDYYGQNVSCYQSTDGAVSVVASGGTPNYSYSWENTGGTTLGSTASLNSIGNGTYNVEVTDINGCAYLTSIVVSQPPVVNSEITVLSNFSGQAVSCDGASDGIIQVAAEGGTLGYTYSWNTSPIQTTPVASNLPTGTYTVTVTDSNGCISTSTVVLTANALPEVDLPEGIYGCIGQEIAINSQSLPGSRCTWEFSDGQVIDDCGPTTVFFEDQDCYGVVLTVISAEGCTTVAASDSFICIMGDPNASFYADNYDLTSLENGTNFFNTSTGAVTYMWDFGDGTDTESFENGYHTFISNNDFEIVHFPVTLYAYSEYGCVDTSIMYINVNPELIFYVPNAFTPDGDDFNNIFKPIFSSGYRLKNYGLKIFDRWGEVVYETNTIGDGWDGTSKGRMCQDGVYTWKLVVMNAATDKKEIHVGHVSLLKGANSF